MLLSSAEYEEINLIQCTGVSTAVPTVTWWMTLKIPASASTSLLQTHFYMLLLRLFTTVADSVAALLPGTVAAFAADPQSYWSLVRLRHVHSSLVNFLSNKYRHSALINIVTVPSLACGGWGISLGESHAYRAIITFRWCRKWWRLSCLGNASTIYAHYLLHVSQSVNSVRYVYITALSYCTMWDDYNVWLTVLFVSAVPSDLPTEERNAHNTMSDVAASGHMTIIPTSQFIVVD